MVDLASSSPLNASVNRIVEHYASLFFLPSFGKVVAVLAAICIGMLGLSTIVFLPSIEGLAYGIIFGASLFALSLFADYLTINFILRKDAIFVMRRTAALSLFSLVLWSVFMISGVILDVVFSPGLWVKLSLFGLSAVVTLRGVVFFSVSAAVFIRRAFATLLEPLLCMIPFLTYWATFSHFNLVQVLSFLIIAPFVSLAAANVFVSLIDRIGVKSYGVPAMSLFRAFMLNWVGGLNAPIERHFEQLGKDEDIEVALLQFKTQTNRAAIIVPHVHPGPFKNIGSSLLPSLLKHQFENVFGGNACVPLGILGHELDLASQAQNQKIIDNVILSAKQAVFSDHAKPFVNVTEGCITVSCQIFGDEAFLSFTLAPETTEDLPQELGHYIVEEARNHGLKGAIAVNAHNSITNVTDMNVPLNELKAVASKCLSNAVLFPYESFELGAATVYPREFSLKDGMGPGGITAIAVRVMGQKTAYVIVDGNNMISGLREKILSALSSIGFDQSEIFTTDTHAVNALVPGRRGYYPVGESMQHELLFDYIKKAGASAMAELGSCETSCLNLTVPKVRVIGQHRIRAISALIDEALKRAKRVVVPIFALEGFLLFLLLAIM